MRVNAYCERVLNFTFELDDRLMSMRKIRHFTRFGFILLIALVCTSACGVKRPTPITKVSEVRPPYQGEVVNLAIPKSKLREALLREDLTQQIRLVEVFRRETSMSNAFSQYRLFDVANGSVYHVLGLRTADLLISVDDYVVKSAGRFRDWVKYLPSEKQTKIEVLRHGKALLLSCDFVE